MDDLTEARLAVSTLGTTRPLSPSVFVTFRGCPSGILVRGRRVLRLKFMAGARLLHRAWIVLYGAPFSAGS